MHGYLVRFLESQDTTFQHIAIWTLVQLLESGDTTLENQVRSSKQLVPLATRLSEDIDGESQPESVTEGSEDGGEGEIRQLAKTVLDLIEA